MIYKGRPYFWAPADYTVNYRKLTFVAPNIRLLLVEYPPGTGPVFMHDKRGRPGYDGDRTPEIPGAGGSDRCRQASIPETSFRPERYCRKKGGQSLLVPAAFSRIYASDRLCRQPHLQCGLLYRRAGGGQYFQYLSELNVYTKTPVRNSLGCKYMDQG